MGPRRHILTFGVVVWLGATWAASFSCFTTQASSDASDVANDTVVDASCTGFGCTDAQVIDPCGDASLALRARATFDQTCTGDPESGCHLVHAGDTTLTLDPTSAEYDAYGLIDIPSSQMPDVLRVAPFHPESSYLYWKVSGDPRVMFDGGNETGTMPLADPNDPTSGVVDPCVAALIGPWIEAGAP